MNNALIILNYNDYDTTSRLVNKVKDYCLLNHIIIVDNNSTDNSCKILQTKYEIESKIEVIKLDSNKGYAYGNNFGINYAIDKYNVDYVFVANPDILFEEDIITKIEKKLFACNKTAIVAPRIDVGYNAWHLPNYLMSIASLFLILGKKYGNLPYKNFSNESVKVDVVAGSFFAIKSSVFKDVGGFEEETFLYYEENILAYKLRKRKYDSFILSNITFKHLHGATIKKNIKSKIRLLKILLDSILVYDKKYLKVGIFQILFLYLCYYISVLERLLWSMICNLKTKK